VISDPCCSDGRRFAPARWLAAACALSCTLLLQEPGWQCQTHAHCQALGASFVCGDRGVCVPLGHDEHETPRPSGSDCQRDADCAGAERVSVCRDGFCRSIDGDGQCLVLGGPEAARADSADAMIIGLLSSRQELGIEAAAGSARPLQPLEGAAVAVQTAIAELNRARADMLDDGVPPLPPLVALACDERDTDALEYMLDALQVRVIVGPTSSERVELALLRVLDRAVLLPPFADAPNLLPSALDPAGLLLACRPNRLSVLPYFLDAAAEARRLIAEAFPMAPPPTAALVVSTDLATQSFADRISDEALADAGLRQLRYGDQTGRDLISVLIDQQPPVDLVIAASMEDDWAANMASYDAAYFERYGTYPYYLLGDDRSEAYEQAVVLQSSAAAPPLRSRLLALGYARGDASRRAFSDFANAYEALAGRRPRAALEYAYDCTYAAVYAAIAAGLRWRKPMLGLAPGALVTGLGALRGEATARLVGGRDVVDILDDLIAGSGLDGSIDLIGASGSLRVQLAGAEAAALAMEAAPAPPKPARHYFNVDPPSGELYCVDATSQALCATGTVFSPSGEHPPRPPNPCNCFGGSLAP
jgi:hypothetical protein